MYKVAKTYQDWEQVGEPIDINSKKYIGVKHPKTGITKNVRVYSDIEYAKIYGKEKEENKLFKNQKKILGFTKGYITIFSGINENNEYWFRNNPIMRYAVAWGWYVTSEEEVPNDLPAGVIPKKLFWKDIGKGETLTKTKEELTNYVNNILNDNNDNSHYVGEIGERLEITITVLHNFAGTGKFGRMNTHIMTDSSGNRFVWVTSSKSWAQGSIKKIRGTVKAHDMYNGIQQTILTRCTELE